jgi:hypothetical protein
MDNKDQRIAQLEAELRQERARFERAYAGAERAMGLLEQAMSRSTETNLQPGQRPFHTDDAAVDRFALALKTKLAMCRAKGRSGWNDPLLAPTSRLRVMLRTCTSKGDPVDVGAMAMMLFDRGERTSEPLSQDILDAVAEAEKTGARAAQRMDQ